MADLELVPRPDLILTAIGGGYLRNPIRRRHATCVVCTTPIASDFTRCFRCNSDRTQPGLADATAFLTYAVADRESGHVMRGYKARPPVAEHRLVVGLLLLLALDGHTKCASSLAGSPVTHWAVVPSLPARPQEHPLRSLVAGRAQGVEVTLLPAANVALPRAINADHFSSDMVLSPGRHVMVIDDTWATGGHAQSAALALRKAGAARVSVLVVARWIKQDYGDNKQFIADLRTLDYDPGICPWTSGECP